MRGSELIILSHNDICLLLDFYGQLLTARTRELMDMHFSEDMSLSEIAENLSITRQAVHDRIQQGEHNLMDLENRLGLAQRYKFQKKCINEAILALENGQVDQVKDQLLKLDGLL